MIIFSAKDSLHQILVYWNHLFCRKNQRAIQLSFLFGNDEFLEIWYILLTLGFDRPEKGEKKLWLLQLSSKTSDPMHSRILSYTATSSPTYLFIGGPICARKRIEVTYFTFPIHITTEAQKYSSLKLHPNDTETALIGDSEGSLCCVLNVCAKAMHK